MKPYLVASIVVFWKTTLSQVQLPHVFFVQVFVCCGYGEMNHIREIGIRPFWTCTWYQTVQKHAATADEIKSNLKMKTKPWISIRTWGCEKKKKHQYGIPLLYFYWIHTFRLSKYFCEHICGNHFVLLWFHGQFHTPGDKFHSKYPWKKHKKTENDPFFSYRRYDFPSTRRFRFKFAS